jgi:signal transduction histidine kinase
MTRFGRDSLWAAVAFAWYGLLGQAFTRESALPPSTVINQGLFLQVFGFPVQLMRAAAAVVAAIFVIRFLRSFEVERRAQIAELQAARLQEAEQRETLRGELLGRVVAAQEAERQRIARELHDETGQALTATGLGLRGIATSLHQNPERAAGNLNQLEKLVSEALTELQRLIADLRPSHLDDLGLPATLRWWADEVESRGSLRVEVSVIGEEKNLAAPVRLAIFRMTQEALTNTIKHSGASKAKVELTYREDLVSVMIADNGRGFDMNQVMSDKIYQSWGLLGMQERAFLLGGQVRIESQPGAGTRVMITIPYQPRIEDADSEVPDDNSAVTS